MEQPSAPLHLNELTDAAELGAISDRSVRLWLRAPGMTTVSATLQVDRLAPVTATAACTAATDWTAALDLTLPQPAPNAPFVCQVGERRLSGRLAPTAGKPTAFSFAFGSCHLPWRATPDGRLALARAAAIYPLIQTELAEAEARFLILLGDQIYADHFSAVGVGATLPPSAEPPSFDDALAAYRGVYRRFFGERGFQALRGSLPTLCTWDDHEIMDDWGSHEQASARDRRLFAAACRAYAEYQHQRNPDGGLGPPPYCWSLPFGDTACFALDLRGVRDYSAGRLLGGAQWERLHDWLASADTARARTLFIVTSVPVAHVSRWFTTACHRLPFRMTSAIRDRWASPVFRAGRDELLHALCDWQVAEAGRQVFLLSGDVHAAAAFSIARRRGGGVVHQLTSSPLTTPLSVRPRLFSEVAIQAPNLFEGDWLFRRHLLSFRHNVGLVRVEPTGGGHRVRFTVRAYDPCARSLRTAGDLTWTPAGAVRSLADRAP